MKQLSGLDASFLYMETPEMPMHVGALHLFELPASYKGSFLDDVRRHIGLRLPLAPALSRKLAWMPFNLANPVWVDAAPDLTQHIVGIKLPKGSGLAELDEQVSQLHPVLLDRDRPLWKFHVFEGLAPGPDKTRRVGLYTQLHHAAVDGQAAIALAQAILDVQATPRSIEHETRAAKKLDIGLADMLSGVLANQLQQYGNLVKALPSTVGALSQVATQGVRSVAGRAVAQVRGSAGDASIGLAPRTRLNASVSDGRAFAGVSLPIAQIKTLRRAHAATLNDVVLMLCGGALRRHFLQHGPLPRKSMVAAVPVSTRAAGDTTANNQASMTVVNLGTHIADPMERLLYVKAASAAMKSTLGSVKSLMPTDFPSLGVPWLMSTVTSLYGKARVADRIPPFANVTISNVPGPAFPLYMAGAKMLTNYPTSIVVHGLALNITLQSYNQSLEFGIIACARAEPHVRDLAIHVKESFEEMKALPATAAAVSHPAAAAAKQTDAQKPARRVPKATAKPRASAPSANRASR
jgi:diacylglycerol O-acyltransferase